MTKKKQKKGKADKAAKVTKSARAEAPKLPKRIAGVKVPKELREPGGKLLEAVRHPLVMDVAAAALMASAAGLRKGSPGTAATKSAPDLGTLLTATALEGVRRLGDALARKANGGGATAPGKPGESGR